VHTFIDASISLLKQFLTFSTTAINDTIVSDIRTNRLRINGLPRTHQFLIIIGLIIIAIVVGVMLTSNQIRHYFTLIVLPIDAQGYGTLVPLQAIGGILVGLSLAWSLLFSALSMLHWGIRLALAITYGGLALLWLTPMATVNLTVCLGLLGLLLINLGILMWRKSLGSIGGWVLFFISQTLLFAVPQWHYYSIYTASGIGTLFAGVEFWVVATQIIVIPMMMYVGINMARAAIGFGQWSAYTVQRTNFPLLCGIALSLSLVRLWQITTHSMPTTTGIIVALIYCGSIGLIWWGTRMVPLTVNHQSVDELLSKWAVWIVIGANVPLLLPTFVHVLFGTAMIVNNDNHSLSTQIWSFFRDRSTAVLTLLTGILALILIVISIRLWRRQRYTASLLLASICISNVIIFVCKLINVIFPPIFSDNLIMIGIMVFMLQKIIRRQTIQLLLPRYIIVLVLSILMQQTSFLNNPLSPVLGFAGVAFVAFGFIWDVLFGVTWINQDSRQFPRIARVLGYIGYSLLTVTAVAWAGISQNPVLLSLLSGDIVYQGYHFFGMPAIHLLYAVTLIAPHTTWQEYPSPETVVTIP
jgi:hypothetical protein